MKIEITKIGKVKPNPENPRVLKDDKFKKLVDSISSFPQMMELRPIVVDENMMILGGNMRFRACQELGLKEVPVVKAENFTDEQKKEFIIKDNVSFGEWDWDMLANGWDVPDSWGLDVWNNDQDALFDIEETEDGEEEQLKPSIMDNDHSVFELVMLHDHKILLIEELNKVKNAYHFEKQEDALMEILREYKKTK